MSKGEFEDRNRQHEVDGVTTGTRRSGLAKQAMKQAPLGSPPVEFGVRSVFDSRPVLSKDFTIGIAANPTLINPTNARYTATFSVPRGYVAILKEVFLSIAPATTPAPADIPQELSTRGEWVRNTAPVIVPDQAIGIVTGQPGQFFILNAQEKYTQFLLGDENDTLGLNVYMFDTGDPTAFVVLMNFTGVLLNKTAVPYQYEVANRMG